MGKTVRRICTLTAVVVAVWVGPANAQSVYTGVQPPGLGPVEVGQTGAVLGSTDDVLASRGVRLQAVQSTQASRLALTGTDVMSLIAIGGGAIAIGAVLKRRADA